MKQAHEKIEATAAEAVRTAATITPFTVAKPVTLRWELAERGVLPGHNGVRVLDGRTYESVANTVEEALYR